VKRAAAGLGVTLAIVACAQLGTEAGGAVSIAFDALPAPSVAAGYVLQNVDGEPTPLGARAFNADGKVIPNAPIAYLALDALDAIHIDADGTLRADSVKSQAVRIVASIGGLQSLPQTLQIVRRPDSLASASTPSTLRWSLADTTTFVSSDLTVKALSDSAGTFVVVPFLVVKYRFETPGDSVVARLVNEAGRASSIDTTVSSGTAFRRIKVIPGAALVSRTTPE